MKIKEVQDALEQISEEKITQLIDLVETHDKIIIIGNGGSNAIASHIAQDYTKQLKKRAVAFSDPSRLTCYINDYGMDNAYTQFVKEFTTKKSLVILISSSGNSQNILNCAAYCAETEIDFITLTGFDSNNKLRDNFGEKSLVDFWVDSHCYGVVECTHQIILHVPS